MTLIDSAPTARPDRRASLKLATGVIVVALAVMIFYSLDDLVGALGLRILQNSVALSLAVLWAVVGIWYLADVDLRSITGLQYRVFDLPGTKVGLIVIGLCCGIPLIVMREVTSILFIAALAGIASRGHWSRLQTTFILTMLCFGMSAYLIMQRVQQSPFLSTVQGGQSASGRFYVLLSEHHPPGLSYTFLVYRCNSIGLFCEEYYTFEDLSLSGVIGFVIDRETGMPQVVADGEVIYTVPVPE